VVGFVAIAFRYMPGIGVNSSPVPSMYPSKPDAGTSVPSKIDARNCEVSSLANSMFRR